MDDIIITGSNGRINNNIPKKLFRLSTENKNLLAKAGSLYYGTGETEEVTLTTVNDAGNAVKQTYQIPITKAVEPPIGGIKNGVYYGIKFHVRNDQTIESAQMIGIPVAPLVSGVYLWNDYLSQPSRWSMQDVNFVSAPTSGGLVKFTAIEWENYNLYYIPEDAPDHPIQVYSYDEGGDPEFDPGTWTNSGYKTINFSTTPQLVSEAFYWDFITDATPQ